MVNSVFDECLVLIWVANAFQNLASSDEVQYLSRYTADAVGDMVFIKVRAGLADGFLESLMNRHDQPGCYQIAGDRIGTHLAIDCL